MRLDLAQLLRPNQFQPGHLIRDPSLVKMLKPRQFLCISRNDDFTAKLVGNGVLVTKTDQSAFTSHTRPRLQGAGIVIHAGVNHTTVVPTLVLGNPWLLFKHNQPQTRPARQ